MNKKTARTVRTQVQSVRTGRPGRGAADHTADRIVLLARRAARRRGRFCGRHRCARVGKSVTLRVLAERLAGLRDVQVGVLSRPQAGMADFYREMGELFGVELHPHNRHSGAKVLRARWQGHIDASLSRRC